MTKETTMTANPKRLPTYSREEEIANSISHLIGFIFSIGTLVFFFIESLINHLGFIYMLPYYVYSLCMMMVFFVSSFYHSSKFGSKRRAVTRIIDHCDIYAFVAATYFPICVYGLTNKSMSITIMIIEVALAIVGIVINLIPKNNKALNIIAYIIYIIDGWLMIFFYPFGSGLAFTPFLFILLGGIIYSIGAVTYAIGSKKKWFHSIFHVFVVLAAITQFIGIYFILMS